MQKMFSHAWASTVWCSTVGEPWEKHKLALYALHGACLRFSSLVTVAEVQPIAVKQVRSLKEPKAFRKKQEQVAV